MLAHLQRLVRYLRHLPTWGWTSTDFRRKDDRIRALAWLAPTTGTSACVMPRAAQLAPVTPALGSPAEELWAARQEARALATLRWTLPFIRFSAQDDATDALAHVAALTRLER